MQKVLSPEEARRHYDRLGIRQDRELRYEAEPLRRLAESSKLGHARSVGEFGCGTGHFARSILETRLGTDATYVGFDSSSTMAAIAANRLSAFEGRTLVVHTDGSVRIPCRDGSFDRFFINYVLDLLPKPDIAALIGDVHRALTPDGLICLAALSTGKMAGEKLVSAFWKTVHALLPRRVGGCRPLMLSDFLDATCWEYVDSQTLMCGGAVSQIVVCRRTTSCT